MHDAGALDWGYKEAVRQGLLRGPRLFASNGVLAQTGGHADFRPRTMAESEPQIPGLCSIGSVVDGPDQERWCSREILRRGADQIKVMVNGGCVSPTDELNSVQFTVPELTLRGLRKPRRKANT